MTPSISSFGSPSDPDPGSFRFNDYVFHMLSAIGAAAFYAGTAKFGIPIFSPRILQMFTAPLQTLLPESTPGGGGELRLKSPIVTTFDGKPIHWIRWKTRTATTFISTGYGRIIDGTYDTTDSLMVDKASSVFAWLIESTSDGSACWLVSQHKSNMDGHAAWQSLCAWCDGDEIKTQIAQSFRNRIHSAALIPGRTGSHFINDFMSAHHQLKEMPEHRMTEAEAKELCVETCLWNLTTMMNQSSFQCQSQQKKNWTHTKFTN